MAESTTRLSLDEVRASVKRMQTEGERLVRRLRKDASALVERGTTPGVRRLREELRQRAERTWNDIDAQRSRARKTLDEVIARLTERVAGAFNVPTKDAVEELSRRLGKIERRLDELSKDRAA